VKKSDSQGNVAYLPSVLPYWLLIFLAITVELWFFPQTGLLLCILVSLYSLRGSKQSLESYFVLAYILIFGEGNIELGRWLILFAGALRVGFDTLRDKQEFPKIVGPILIFFLTVFTLSFISSDYLTVSLFKIVVLTIGLITIFTLFYRTQDLISYWLALIFTLGVFILFISLPFYGSEIGFRRNRIGFQGILVHPQTYGPVIASFTAFFISLYLYRNAHSLLVIAGIILGLAGIFTSRARTGMLAFVIGLVGVVLLLYIVKAGKRDFKIKINPALLIIGLLTLIFMTLNFDNITRSVHGYIFKYGSASNISEAVTQSRSALTERSMQNFYESPLTGIGFGVPSSQSGFHATRGPFGIPIAASIEKGFLPSAILEEIGIIGAVSLVMLLFFLLKPVILSGTPLYIWIVLIALSVNLGESILFSLGGMGFFFWVLIAFCFTAASNLNVPALSE